jgi:hypothetical protein
MASTRTTKKPVSPTPATRQPRRPGRPSTFEEVRWEVVGLLVAGNTLAAAAAEVGVTPRAVQLWRRRAYSSRPEDQPFVAFEKALMRGLLAAAEAGQEVLAVPPSLPLDELLAEFEGDLDLGID